MDKKMTKPIKPKKNVSDVKADNCEAKKANAETKSCNKCR
jgi:hypothetical protein